jgi:hypothetical protein
MQLELARVLKFVSPQSVEKAPGLSQEVGKTIYALLESL